MFYEWVYTFMDKTHLSLPLLATRDSWNYLILHFFKNIYILEKSTSEEHFQTTRHIISIFKTFWDFGMKASKS